MSPCNPLEPDVFLLRRLSLTLPVLALPLAAAQAAELSPAEGLRILAMAANADSRCNILSRREHAELMGYQTRAEMAAAHLLDAGSRSAAVAAGTAEGRKAACNAGLATDIRETLKAAREAVAAADGKSAARPDPVEVFVPRSATGALSLPSYVTFLKPYYADLRCRSLSKGDALNYWQAIRRLQKAMVAKYGVATVAKAQARARAQSRSIGCAGVAAAAQSANR